MPAINVNSRPWDGQSRTVRKNVTRQISATINAFMCFTLYSPPPPPPPSNNNRTKDRRSDLCTRRQFLIARPLDIHSLTTTNYCHPTAASDINLWTGTLAELSPRDRARSSGGVRVLLDAAATTHVPLIIIIIIHGHTTTTSCSVHLLCLTNFTQPSVLLS